MIPMVLIVLIALLSSKSMAKQQSHRTTAAVDKVAPLRVFVDD